MRRPPRIVIVSCAVAVACAMTGCSSSGPPTRDVTSTTVETLTTTPKPNPSPVPAGPTSAVAAGSCPYLDTQDTAGDVGMRLARITVLKSGGKVIGCRFYALQNDPLATSEHLPGPNQPVVQIVSSHYADPTAAHNALALAAQHGTNASTVTVSTGVPGVVYQTSFDPADRGQDWVCAFAKGTTLVVVTTAVTNESRDALTLARHIVARF